MILDKAECGSRVYRNVGIRIMLIKKQGSNVVSGGKIGVVEQDDNEA